MASSVQNIKLAGGTVYWGLEEVGRLSEDGITVSVNGNIVDVFTAESGATPEKTFSSGDTVEVVCTFRELDKHILVQAMGSAKATVATDDETATVGVLSGGREAGFVIPTKPLTIYPHFVDESTGEPLGDTVANLWAFRIHKARPSTEMSFLFSPSEPVAPEVTFAGLYDKTKTNGNRVWQWGSGVVPVAS